MTGHAGGVQDAQPTQPAGQRKQISQLIIWGRPSTEGGDEFCSDDVFQGLE